jgi:hypothetical protein
MRLFILLIIPFKIDTLFSPYRASLTINIRSPLIVRARISILLLKLLRVHSLLDLFFLLRFTVLLIGLRRFFWLAELIFFF